MKWLGQFWIGLIPFIRCILRVTKVNGPGISGLCQLNRAGILCSCKWWEFSWLNTKSAWSGSVSVVEFFYLDTKSTWLVTASGVALCFQLFSEVPEQWTSGQADSWCLVTGQFSCLPLGNQHFFLLSQLSHLHRLCLLVEGDFLQDLCLCLGLGFPKSLAGFPGWVLELSS